MTQTSVVLRACSLLQAVYGQITTRRLCGTMSIPGSPHERWIVSGIVTSTSADHRRVVTRETIYDVADYASELSPWWRNRVAWHLWCRTRSVPDRLEWLQPDRPIDDAWTHQQVVASIRAAFAERERLRRAIDDALDGDSREV